MKDKELDPVLQALLDAEAATPLVGAADVKGQILENVLAAASNAALAGTAAAAGSAVTASSAGAWTTKPLVLIALASGVAGVGVGVGATVLTLEPEAAPVQVAEPEAQVLIPQEEAPKPPEPNEAEQEAEPETVVEAPAPTMRPTSRMVVEPQTVEEERTSDLADERVLIDQALSALRASQAHDAMVALMSHERRFPRGSLAEERDRLSVEALVQLGRRAQAERRAALFMQRYPNSPHRQRVQAMVED